MRRRRGGVVGRSRGARCRMPLQWWHADTGTDQPTRVGIGHIRVGEDVQHLVK